MRASTSGDGLPRAALPAPSSAAKAEHHDHTRTWSRSSRAARSWLRDSQLAGSALQNTQSTKSKAASPARGRGSIATSPRGMPPSSTFPGCGRHATGPACRSPGLGALQEFDLGAGAREAPLASLPGRRGNAQPNSGRRSQRAPLVTPRRAGRQRYGCRVVLRQAWRWRPTRHRRCSRTMGSRLPALPGAARRHQLLVPTAPAPVQTAPRLVARASALASVASGVSFRIARRLPARWQRTTSEVLPRPTGSFTSNSQRSLSSATTAGSPCHHRSTRSPKRVRNPQQPRKRATKGPRLARCHVARRLHEAAVSRPQATQTTRFDLASVALADPVTSHKARDPIADACVRGRSSRRGIGRLPVQR